MTQDVLNLIVVYVIFEHIIDGPLLERFDLLRGLITCTETISMAESSANDGIRFKLDL